ncbi:MAG: FAD-dependent oxidoreductase [Alphaproteobacteria bacterium]|nr:FAD-dependent oxidoreductase [Alphaproteobacteria bacterium]
MTIRLASDANPAVTVPIVIVGAGACGLVAALRAVEAGGEVLVLERDAVPSGSTALSSGMIPAAGTVRQKARGVTDSAEGFAGDIQGKSKGRSDPVILKAVTEASGRTVDWLNGMPEIDLQLVEGFLYPGHSVMRMHAPPDRTGRSLIGMLHAAATARQIDIMTGATVTDLYARDDGHVTGVRIVRPDGTAEDIGCEALILACNGFGGNPDMVAEHIPEMSSADYFGHPGNQGDAVTWGLTLGGEAKHMSAYQGHGSVATPHGILITWALMMEGGIQVNAAGHRFSNEHAGYSEQAVSVLAQPGGVAWNIYDARRHQLGLDFDDYRAALAQGAVREADDIAGLAETIGVPVEALRRSVAETAQPGPDRFGRRMGLQAPLEAPFYAVKVTGALFHTQGGLRVDANGRVLRRGTDRPIGNLYAGGGAACGVSGPFVDGYLSGNGLLTAVTLGNLAGSHAARSR